MDETKIKSEEQKLNDHDIEQVNGGSDYNLPDDIIQLLGYSTERDPLEW